MKECGAIAIDVGTSSCKLGIVNIAGEVLFNRRTFFPILTEEKLSASLLFSIVLEELNFALNWSLENQLLLLGICISGNGPTLVSVDKTDRTKDVLFMWNEKIASDLQEIEFEKFMGDSISIFLPRLIAFKNKYAQSYQNAQYLLPLVEYLSFRLTGKAYTLLPEERFATYYWKKEELEYCMFNHSLLAPFVELGFCAGTYKGVKVFLGPPDYVAALIGSSCLFPNTACDVAGSSEGINITVESVPSQLPKRLRLMPSPTPKLWTIAALFSDVGIRFAKAVKDLNKTYMFRTSNIEDNFLEVMEVISDFYFKNLEISNTKKITMDIIKHDIFDKMKGVSLDDRILHAKTYLPHPFYNIYYEVMSVLSSLKDAFNLLEKTTGFRGSYVLSGGHAKNEAYTKMKAHFTQRSFSLLQHRDAELLGDAVIVLYRCGIYTSLQEATMNVVKVGKDIFV